MLADIQNLDYRYKGAEREALCGVGLDVREGEVLGLIGPDGAGKTTMLRLMAGLLKPDAGKVELLGLDPLARHGELSHRIGYMTQRFSLYEDLTVAENLRLCASLRGMSAQEAARQRTRLLKAAGLEAFTDRLAGKLSGGMRQKLALICALYGHPEILLLDEPGVGVDPLSRRELWQLVDQARGDKRGIVWATAYLDEAARCDRVCILHEGRVLYLGTPSALLAQASANELKPANFEEAFIHLMGDRTEARRGSVPPVAAPHGPADTDAPVIVTEGLTRRFGDFIATDHLNLRVRRGEVFGILGANGAGKTTAFRMICGLLKPSEGHAEILGMDLRKEARRIRAHIGYMAQKFSLYAKITVLQNLQFFARIYGLPRARQRERIAALADRFGLETRLNHPAGSLPPGIRQRLSMACALIHEPEFLFLDEPTSGVDPFARREFWEDINALSAAGVTVIVTTHFMDEAQYLHRLVIMNHGKVIAEGTPESIRAAAATAEQPAPTMEDAFIRCIREGGEP